jgi:predicted DNA-binding transcriptional regulator YafY
MKTGKKPSRVTLPKTALPRIYRIDAKIASGEYPNSDDLADLCETSVSTISRDIEFMREQLLAPVEYDPLNRGYHYTKERYRLPAGFTSADDLLALGMAKSILSLYRETPLYEASSHLLESITTPLASDGNCDWLENRIVVPPVASAKVDGAIWEIIVKGLKENRIVTFDYRGTWDDEFQNRKVRPYQLLFDSGVWYLYGFSEERKATRIFSLPRIKNARITKEVFSLPRNCNYADFTGGSYFGVFIGLEKRQFVINCYEEAAIYATDRQWAADQKITDIDGGIKMEFTSTQYDKVLKWVLSCGYNAVPVKPQKLVSDWKWHIREMRKLAGK